MWPMRAHGHANQANINGSVVWLGPMYPPSKHRGIQVQGGDNHSKTLYNIENSVKKKTECNWNHRRSSLFFSNIVLYRPSGIHCKVCLLTAGEAQTPPTLHPPRVSQSFPRWLAAMLSQRTQNRWLPVSYALCGSVSDTLFSSLLFGIAVSEGFIS